LTTDECNTQCSAGFGAVAGATSAATGCSSIAAGFYLPVGSLTPIQCPQTAGTYCPGFSSATGVTFAAAGNAITANTATSAVGVYNCPFGVTGTAGNGGQAIATSCTDLAAGYMLVPGVAATTKLASLIQACPAGATCAGISAFFGGTLSNGGTSGKDDNWYLAGVGACSGATTASASNVNCLTALDLVNSTDITAAVSTLTAGVPLSATVNSAAYVAGQTNQYALFGFVLPGYYIAPHSFTPVPCPTGSFCGGGEGLGDFADFDMPPTPCPTGTKLGPDKAPAQGSAAGVAGSIQCTPGTDCVGCALLPGFYSTSTGQAAICPPNYYCPGGGYLGSSATSFQCPTANSTVEACNTFLDNIQSNSYAAGNTTITTAPAAAAPAVTTPAAAAPSVTVSPAAVTVSPAPIVVNFTHSPVFASDAPRAAAHAAVLTLAALAALVAF
jgi:hypothetical protein